MRHENVSKRSIYLFITIKYFSLTFFTLKEYNFTTKNNKMNNLKIYIPFLYKILRVALKNKVCLVTL